MEDKIEYDKNLIKLTKAFIKTGKYNPEDLPNLLKMVHNSLINFAKEKNDIIVNQHLFDDHFICLMCGKQIVLLSKHLTQCHHIKINDYKKLYNLPGNYPSVPNNYSDKRSFIAKNMKLGAGNTRSKNKK